MRPGTGPTHDERDRPRWASSPHLVVTVAYPATRSRNSNEDTLSNGQVHPFTDDTQEAAVVKKAAIVLVVLLGLLVVADFSAAAMAEYQVSKRLREHLELQDDPSVRINGFPFTLQAFDGDYREIEVTADRVTVARLRDIGVEATLRHVRVPFSELVSGSADSVRVDEVVGRVRIQAAALGELINVENLVIEEVDDRDRADGADLPANAVKLAGTVEVLNTRTKVSVISSLDLSGGQVQITAHSVEVGGQELPADAVQAVLNIFTTRLDPGALPFTVTPTSVTADNGSLVVEGTAHNVALSSASSPR